MYDLRPVYVTRTHRVRSVGRWHFRAVLVRFAACIAIDASNPVFESSVTRPPRLHHRVHARFSEKTARRFRSRGARHTRSQQRDRAVCGKVRDCSEPIYVFGVTYSRTEFRVARLISKRNRRAFTSRFNLDYADIGVTRDADVTRESQHAHENDSSSVSWSISSGTFRAVNRAAYRHERSQRKRRILLASYWSTDSLIGHWDSRSARSQTTYGKSDRSIAPMGSLAREIPSLVRSDSDDRGHRSEKGHFASARDFASHWDEIGTVNADGGCDPAWHPGPRGDSSEEDFGGDICRLPREKLPTLE